MTDPRSMVGPVPGQGLAACRAALDRKKHADSDSGPPLGPYLDPEPADPCRECGYHQNRHSEDCSQEDV